jgi:hypothetical protein
MSPEPAAHIYTPPRMITIFGTGPVLEPLAEPVLDFLFRRVGIGSPQVLTHEGDTSLE